MEETVNGWSGERAAWLMTGQAAKGLEGLAAQGLEGLAAGGLEGLAAAGFYICFFGQGGGAVLAGAGIGVYLSAAFLLPGMLPWAGIFSACWIMFVGYIYKVRQWQELFLAGGTWLIIRSLACLRPDAPPLQTVSALAVWAMAALCLLGRGRVYPLWLATLAGMWLMAGFLDGIAYETKWQGQAARAAGYLALGGVFVFQQIFCIRQEMRRKIWEDAGKRREEAGRPTHDDREENWRKAADREYRRLQIFEHDFRHHLDMLGALYEEGDPAEARAYLEDLKQARFSGRGQKYGGEREISCIMMAKKEDCRRAGIPFSYQILGSPRGIAQMDMTALLLNLLDNAVRACEKSPEPRSIGIMLLARGDLWQIELANTGAYAPGERGDGGQESPEQGQARELRGGIEPRQDIEARSGTGAAHGIGLISVRQIVEKYQGIFEVRQEGNMVIQKVILAGQFPE